MLVGVWLVADSDDCHARVGVRTGFWQSGEDDYVGMAANASRYGRDSVGMEAICRNGMIISAAHWQCLHREIANEPAPG